MRWKCLSAEYTILVFAEMNAFLLTLASLNGNSDNLKTVQTRMLELKTNQVMWEMSQFRLWNKSYNISFARTNYNSTHVNWSRWHEIVSMMLLKISCRSPLSIAIDFVLISLSSQHFFTDLSMIYSFWVNSINIFNVIFLFLSQVSYPIHDATVNFAFIQAQFIKYVVKTW